VNICKTIEWNNIILNIESGIMKNIKEFVNTGIKTNNNNFINEPNFGQNGITYSNLEPACDICGKIFSDNNRYQFFPEDGSYICNNCLKRN